MHRRFRNHLAIALACLVTWSLALGQTAKPVPPQAAPPAAPQAATVPAPDLTAQPTLYVVAYAHLDTQWRWDYVTTIRDYLPKTLRLNFDWIDKYPHYVFNFSGANRYRMIKEYYPAEYQVLKKAVAAGRWFPAGSSMEENDVNSPSAESIIRQILYGKAFFRREFGKTSAEYMLPDCFGFPASLPSILAHCGIKGFSTQKLSSSWQPAPRVGGPDSPEKTPEGIPFNVGVWEGPDGRFVVAALNPGSYEGQVGYDLSKSPPPPPPPDPNQPRRGVRGMIDWPARIQLNGQVTGAFADYMYYGTGDTGGSANESSIRLMESIVTRSRTVLPVGGGRGQPAQPAGPEVLVGDGPVKVVSATSEQLFLDLKPEQIAKMPRYQGDLELINHSAGSITSQAHMKRWNRKNEVLADAAEKASIAAELLAGRAYPLQRLNDAWTLVMGGQFHDIIPGTSIPKAYEYAWNDELLAMNQFATVLTGAAEAVASVLDTRAAGVPIVVYNSLNIPREDVVEATVKFATGIPRAVEVIGPDGTEAPAQVTGEKDGAARIVFVARAPSAGFAVYDVRPAEAQRPSSLRVTESSLENGRYLVRLDQNGDVASIRDKTLNRELLSAPIRLALLTDNPAQWPAWNMDFEDVEREPRAYVSGPATIRIAENGPARVALEVAREGEGSKFVQTIRLSAGDSGNRVEFSHMMDWNTREANLKATFPLAPANAEATYNWDIGTIRRPNARERQFEVATHQWVDLTDAGGAYGVTILTDCKIASDKPNDNTLRLTLVRTPGTRGGYADQGTQDLGHHEFVYGLAGHAGDHRRGQTDWQALRLNQPLVAFQSPSHEGPVGKTFELLKLDNSRIRVLAFKKAEQGNDEYVIRLVEMEGAAVPDVRVRFAFPLAAAREVNGAEEPVGPANVSGGELATSFKPFQPRTFAVRFGPISAKRPPVRYQAAKLPCDLSVSTPEGRPGGGYFDSDGRAIPAEMLPGEIAYGAIRFALAPRGYGRRNALIPRGQTLTLPPGNFSRLYILAAAAGQDTRTALQLGDTPVELTIQDWSGYIGQWDNRIWNVRLEPVPLAPQQAAQQQGRQAQAGAGGRGTQSGRGQAAAPPAQPVRMRTVEEMVGLTQGYIKPAPVAWFSSHRHGPDGGNEPYAYAYLFAYAVDIPAGTKTLTLPVSERIRILAITLSDEGPRVLPAQVLTDYLER